MNRFRIIIAWVFGVSFIATGIMKFANLDAMSAGVFQRANYPHWLWIVVATLELGGGMLSVIKSTRKIGLIIIAAVMLGAIGTHIYLMDNYVHLIVPSIILLISVYVSLAYKSQLIKQKFTA